MADLNIATSVRARFERMIRETLDEMCAALKAVDGGAAFKEDTRYPCWRVLKPPPLPPFPFVSSSTRSPLPLSLSLSHLGHGGRGRRSQAPCRRGRRPKPRGLLRRLGGATSSGRRRRRRRRRRIGGFSLSIWPPTQRTRDAVIRRLVENLTSSTVLSKRYGVVPADEAEESARAVEREAFAAASAAAAADAEGGGAKGGDSVEEGIEVLHVYSKEISRRLLEFAKSRASVASPASSLPSAASDAPTEGAASAAEVASPPAVGEEASADASEASTA
ncbi:MFP1 attachment factor 1 [Ananas comosus]|uniref:MFP1 attachment factor 1 n=1 Tax=Ananas comosus TaxID=4615 RepID=A0A199VTQ8_ANACO|nr:MFP1 attachment factor 1 [Ananas comosus]